MSAISHDGRWTERLAITVRFFVDAQLREEATREFSAKEMHVYLRGLAERYARQIAERPFLVEVEFLDEPNPLERFMRYGTDPHGMVMPVAISPPNSGTVH